MRITNNSIVSVIVATVLSLSALPSPAAAYEHSLTRTCRIGPQSACYVVCPTGIWKIKPDQQLTYWLGDEDEMISRMEFKGAFVFSQMQRTNSGQIDAPPAGLDSLVVIANPQSCAAIGFF